MFIISLTGLNKKTVKTLREQKYNLINLNRKLINRGKL